MDNLSETTSRFGGTLGAALLTAVLFALVLGVYGAVYINAFRPSAPQPAPIAATKIPTPATAPAPKDAAVPPAMIEQVEQVNPSAGRNTPAPIEAIKPDHQGDARYWVEFAAYRGTFYAAKLVKRLASAGIKSEIIKTHGINGRSYYSVRTHTLAGHADAAAVATRVSQFGLAPLIHRDRAPPTKSVNAVVTEVDTPAVHLAAHDGYWVQFGAYNVRGYAVALRDRLRHSGLDVTIVQRQRAGYARYLVRSAVPLQNDDAHHIAARGQAVLGLPPLIGRASGPAA